jgi:hypothetical protein
MPSKSIKISNKKTNGCECMLEINWATYERMPENHESNWQLSIWQLTCSPTIRKKESIWQHQMATLS